MIEIDKDMSIILTDDMSEETRDFFRTVNECTDRFGGCVTEVTETDVDIILPDHRAMRMMRQETGILVRMIRFDDMLEPVKVTGCRYRGIKRLAKELEKI